MRNLLSKISLGIFEKKGRNFTKKLCERKKFTRSNLIRLIIFSKRINENHGRQKKVKSKTRISFPSSTNEQRGIPVIPHQNPHFRQKLPFSGGPANLLPIQENLIFPPITRP